MSATNLVSAELSQSDQSEVLTCLATIREKLPFAVAMSGVESKSLFTAGNTYRPFVDKAYQASVDYPGILARDFENEEYRKDHELAEALAPIVQQVADLSLLLSKTQMALSSDLMGASLDVYAFVRQHRDSVPGLAATADELKVFFKKSKGDKAGSTGAQASVS